MRRFRKKVRRFVRLYWFWVSLGLVLTKVSVEAAYIERGYKAYGGEWLVLPVVMIVGYFVNEARKAGKPTIRMCAPIGERDNELRAEVITKTWNYRFLDGSVSLNGSRNLDSIYRKEQIQ